MDIWTLRVAFSYLFTMMFFISDLILHVGWLKALVPNQKIPNMQIGLVYKR